METGALIAIFTAASAFLVALVNVFAQRANTRELRDFQRRLGPFDKSTQLQVDNLQATRDALADSCRSLQRFRDELQILAMKSTRVLYPEETKRLLEARDDLLATYERHHTTMSDADSKRLHKAKGQVVELCAALVDGTSSEVFGCLSTDSPINRLRGELADCHDALILSSVTCFQRSLRTVERLLHDS